MKITEYEARDGKRFPTSSECRDHEQSSSWGRLIGMTEAEVLAAMDRRDVKLADEIERAGNHVSRVRRATGNFRRRVRKTRSAA